MTGIATAAVGLVPGYASIGIWGDDEGRLAADAIAVVAEDRGSDRPRDEADEIHAERLQRADPWVGAGEVDLAEDQPGHRAVDEEVVPFDCGPDSARDHGAA